MNEKIYFARECGSGYVKIGATKLPIEKHLRNYCLNDIRAQKTKTKITVTKNSKNIIDVTIVSGTQKFDRVWFFEVPKFIAGIIEIKYAIKAYFKKNKIRNDWFSLSDSDLADFFKKLDDGYTKGKKYPTNKFLSSIVQNWYCYHHYAGSRSWGIL